MPDIVIEDMAPPDSNDGLNTVMDTTPTPLVLDNMWEAYNSIKKSETCATFQFMNRNKGLIALRRHWLSIKTSLENRQTDEDGKQLYAHICQRRMAKGESTTGISHLSMAKQVVLDHLQMSEGQFNRCLSEAVVPDELVSTFRIGALLLLPANKTG